MVLLLINSFGFRVLIERDSNLSQTSWYSWLQRKHLFGFILMQHIFLAVIPLPTHGTPYHLHFSQSMLSTGCSPSRIYTPITQRLDSLDFGFEILLPTRAAPFCGSSRSQVPPCPKGSPSGGQPVLNPADGPHLPLTCQLGSSLLPSLLLASFCLPHHPQSQGATGRCQHVLAGNCQP